jgi:putative FmdB family regulatory protein
MPLYDYHCNSCGHQEETIAPSGTRVVACEKCGAVSERVFLSAPIQMTHVIPSYPGCKRVKAGYVHTHGDRPRTKVQGCGFSPSSD